MHSILPKGLTYTNIFSKVNLLVISRSSSFCIIGDDETDQVSVYLLYNPSVNKKELKTFVVFILTIIKNSCNESQ